MTLRDSPSFLLPPRSTARRLVGMFVGAVTFAVGGFWLNNPHLQAAGAAWFAWHATALIVEPLRQRMEEDLK